MKSSILTMILGFTGMLAVNIPAQAGLLTNGDFETGDLTGWNVFTTSNGSTGPGLPAVVNFDTTGSGASLAAKFNVGNATAPNQGEQGGGLDQSFTAPVDGFYLLSLDIAAANDANGQNNSEGGVFSVLVDNSTVDSHTFGNFATPFQIVRGSLSGSVFLSAGPHQLEILITRSFTTSGDATPTQYIDNATITAPAGAVPEPATVCLSALALAGLASARFLRSRKA